MTEPAAGTPAAPAIDRDEEPEAVLAARSVATSLDGYRTDIRSARHHVIADEPVDRGGTDEGPSPLQLLLGAVASCTNITLHMYAERKGWDLGPVKVDCRMFFADGDRKRQSIERSITIGGALDDAQRARLADIAERTPVTLAVRGATPIVTTMH
jgi:putative redox protein